MCGIIAVVNHPHAARYVRMGLHNLQHRGEEAVGIASSDGEQLHLLRKRGWVGDVITEEDCDKLPGNMAIGHVRYSTHGGPSGTNTQPLFAKLDIGQIAIGHNGHIVNSEEIRSRLEKDGSIFQTSSDTEVILHLMAKSKHDLVIDRFFEALSQLRNAAFSLVMLTTQSVFVARDRNGIRPLIVGKVDGATIYASESCAIEVLGGKVVSDFQTGTIIEENDTGTVGRLELADSGSPKICIFEYIYFARPDSTIQDKPVYQSRVSLGMQLARECPAEADVVIPVPDSGIEAALGYARESGLPFEKGIIRAHYAGRTFIQPGQVLRNRKIRMKLNPVPSVIRDKRVVVVDDSIVRGNTSRRIVAMLREVGAKEIHMRISSPPIISPCYYGIDTPDTEELIASSQSIETIRESIGADSLKYLSPEGLDKAVGLPQFCDACFTRNYPI